MSDTTNALVKEIEALRAKLGKAIEADAKAGTKALATQQKRTAALRKKVAAATTRATKARAAAKARPTAANKPKSPKCVMSSRP